MWIQGLRLARFRGFEQLSLELASGLNFFFGDNAAGKTSLLEALSVLSRGRSFRSGQLQDLARIPGDGRWQVEARAADPGELPDRWSVRFEDRQLRLERNGQPERRVAAAQHWPLLFLLPTSHQIIDESPAIRRGLLDWALFHVEPSFLETWREYQRALRQRNEALREGQPVRSLAPWTQILARSGQALQRCRADLVRALGPRVSDELERLWPELKLALHLQSGWGQHEKLEDALAAQLETDRRLRFTHSGPHRAELLLKVGGLPARAVLSRGQQKILVAAVSFALAQQLQASQRRWPILLIDDWNAEMGPALAQRFWARLAAYPGQRWVTGFAPPPEAGAAIDRLFHVEQGGVTGC